MPFNDLPVELLDQIAHHIDHDTQSLRSFTRTCKHAHGVLNHLLYRYIVCKDDRSGAKCCRTLVTCPELCAEVKSFTVLGPDTLSRHNPTWLSLLLAFTRDFTASLRGMTNLEYLNCDIAYCSLEVALTLCEATFDRLHSLVIRFDDTSLSSPLRATNDLHKLEKAHLPGLKRVIVRENAQHIQPSTFVDHIVNSRRDSLHDLMLRSRIHSYTSLWRRAPPPIWASLETLSICRAMFDANVLAEMPQIRSFTILQDFEAIQDSISSQILPKLQHLGCQPLNVAAFLPLNLPELGRPIRSVHFNGASSRGGYDSTSAPPSLRHILLGIAHLRFSSDVVEELNIGVSWHDLHGLVDGAVLSLLHPVKHLTLVIIDGRRGLPSWEPDVIFPTNLPTIYQLADSIFQRAPSKLQSLVFPNGGVLNMHGESPALDIYSEKMQQMGLEKWTWLCPTLERAVFGEKFVWRKDEGHWQRIDTVLELEDHDCRYFD